MRDEGACSWVYTRTNHPLFAFRPPSEIKSHSPIVRSKLVRLEISVVQLPDIRVSPIGINLHLLSSHLFCPHEFGESKMQPGLSIHTNGQAPHRSDSASSTGSTKSPPPPQAEMAPISRQTRPMIVGGDEPEPPYPIHLEGNVTHGFGRGARFLGIPTGKSPASTLSERFAEFQTLTLSSQLA